MEYTEIIQPTGARIKVIGVGGGGGNAINNMISGGLTGVQCIAANTDIQALSTSLAEHKLQLGARLTSGLGAGSIPDMGYQAAMENIEQIRNLVADCEMVFVTAGMGGGTGTGAAPVIAQAAKEAGALTVGVVTKPFHFEARRRTEIAEAGIAELRQHVDSLIIIPNDRLLSIAHKKAGFKEMMQKADEVLGSAVHGISDLIFVQGMINLDFADVKTIMGIPGFAMMGEGRASGEGRARDAAVRAITSPLLEDVSISGARGVLINVTSSSDIGIHEVAEASTLIQEEAHDDALVIFGAVFDESLGDEMRITVIATGIDAVDNRSSLSRNPGVALPFRQSAAKPQGGGFKPAGNALPVMGGETERRFPFLDKPGTGGQGHAASSRHFGQASYLSENTEFTFDEGESDIPAFLRDRAN